MPCPYHTDWGFSLWTASTRCSADEHMGSQSMSGMLLEHSSARWYWESEGLLTYSDFSWAFQSQLWDSLPVTAAGRVPSIPSAAIVFHLSPRWLQAALSIQHRSRSSRPGRQGSQPVAAHPRAPGRWHCGKTLSRQSRGQPPRGQPPREQPPRGGSGGSGGSAGACERGTQAALMGRD